MHTWDGATQSPAVMGAPPEDEEACMVSGRVVTATQSKSLTPSVLPELAKEAAEAAAKLVPRSPAL